MTIDLAAYAAEDNGVKYFHDLVHRPVRGTARKTGARSGHCMEMQVEGAGFAGFATWLDMTPAHPDMLAVPDPASVIQLPWKPEVAWVAAQPASWTGRRWRRRHETFCAN